MVQLKINEKDEYIQEECKTHQYSDLPMKGLGKSFESVNINEPVIIPIIISNHIQYGYSKAEMERRAYELNADINYMTLPQLNLNESEKIKVWFLPKK